MFEKGDMSLEDYLENNIDEIDLSRNFSCAAEGHVSHVLSARLSSRPMGWSIQGAERIAKLRAYYFSDGNFSELALDRKTQRKMILSIITLQKSVIRCIMESQQVTLWE